jgi:protocatechuate 3,4-dioxygenase, beta subunit
MQSMSERSKVAAIDANGRVAVDPPYLCEAYRSTILRSPREPLVSMPKSIRSLRAPVYGFGEVTPQDADLTRQHSGEPNGERIIVAGRLTDENGKAIPNALIEIWQANAAGRYTHKGDQHTAPLDPNFTGNGRVLTEADGNYRFVSVKPGAYPWRNHANAWRPAHIHFSLFGLGYLSRLVTQMYFPGDPLLALDPIFNSVPTEQGRQLLVSRFDLDLTEPEWALGYRFDIVLRGDGATPMEK